MSTRSRPDGWTKSLETQGYEKESFLGGLLTATPRQYYAGQYDGAAQCLPPSERFSQSGAGEHPGGDGLQEQTDRGEGGWQVGEGVGDKVLASDLGDDAMPSSINQP